MIIIGSKFEANQEIVLRRVFQSCEEVPSVKASNDDPVRAWFDRITLSAMGRVRLVKRPLKNPLARTCGGDCSGSLGMFLCIRDTCAAS